MGVCGWVCVWGGGGVSATSADLQLLVQYLARTAGGGEAVKHCKVRTELFQELFLHVSTNSGGLQRNSEHLQTHTPILSFPPGGWVAGEDILLSCCCSSAVLHSSLIIKMMGVSHAPQVQLCTHRDSCLCASCCLSPPLRVSLHAFALKWIKVNTRPTPGTSISSEHLC